MPIVEPREPKAREGGPSNATVKKIAVVGIAAISIGLFIPLYFARKRAGNPEDVVKTVATAPSAVSPAALLGRHAGHPKTASAPGLSAALRSRPPPALRKTAAAQAEIEASHNTALHIFGAFSAATAIVIASAGAGVYAVHRATGATTPKEFSTHARNFIKNHMPQFRYRLYGEPDAPSQPNESGRTEWSWPEAEKRLEAAYSAGGIAQWGTQALQEMEAEVRLAKDSEKDSLPP